MLIFNLLTEFSYVWINLNGLTLERILFSLFSLTKVLSMYKSESCSLVKEVEEKLVMNVLKIEQISSELLYSLSSWKKTDDKRSSVLLDLIFRRKKFPIHLIVFKSPIFLESKFSLIFKR